MDYDKLKGRIIAKHYKTLEDFAKALGITRETFSLKLNGKSKFTLEEAKKACELLDIKPEDFHLYFY